jgi:hypothetical protein
MESMVLMEREAPGPLWAGLRAELSAAIAPEAMLRRQRLRVRRTGLARRRACDCRTRCYYGGHPLRRHVVVISLSRRASIGWIDVAELLWEEGLY